MGKAQYVPRDDGQERLSSADCAGSGKAQTTGWLREGAAPERTHRVFTRSPRPASPARTTREPPRLIRLE
jgi:hypothetical protein